MMLEVVINHHDRPNAVIFSESHYDTKNRFKWIKMMEQVL